MTTITQLAPVLQELLTHKADALARSSGFIRRQRKMSGSGFVQGLVLGYLGKPKATRRELHASVLRSGVSISETGLDKRFNAAGALFLRQVVEAALTEQIFAAAPAGLLQQFTEVVLSDATQVKQGRLAVKLATRLFMQSGRLQVSLESVRSHDARAQVCQGQLTPGTLHLGDLGYFDLAQFAQWNQQGVHWLSRYKTGVLLFGLDGQALDLSTCLSAHTPTCQPVRVGRTQALNAWLVAAPVSEAMYAKRLRQLNNEQRKRQRPLTARRYLARWTIYLTSIPNLPFDQALILARTRWQIERLFKLWKSDGAHLATPPSTDPQRCACVLYARFLAILITHWLHLTTTWHHVAASPKLVLSTLRDHALLLQFAFAFPVTLPLVLEFLSTNTASLPPRHSRAADPPAFQLWRAFSFVP